MKKHEIDQTGSSSILFRTHEYFNQINSSGGATEHHVTFLFLINPIIPICYFLLIKFFILFLFPATFCFSKSEDFKRHAIHQQPPREPKRISKSLHVFSDNGLNVSFTVDESIRIWKDHAKGCSFSFNAGHFNFRSVNLAVSFCKSKP